MKPERVDVLNLVNRRFGIAESQDLGTLNEKELRLCEVKAHPAVTIFQVH
jgi:hypothetical protein